MAAPAPGGHVCTLERSYDDGYLRACRCGALWMQARGEILNIITVNPDLLRRLREYRVAIDWGAPGGLAGQVRGAAELARGVREAVHGRARTDWERRQAGKRARRRKHLLSLPCAYCGAKAASIDHIIPWRQGGTDAARNLAPACVRCNSEKGKRTPEQWKAWRLNLGRPWPPENSDLLLAEAVYRFPDADTPDGRRAIQLDAARELRRYSRSPATNVPSPGVITAIPSSRST